MFERLDAHYTNVTEELVYELFKCTLVEILVYLLGQNTVALPAIQTNERIEQIISYIENNLLDIRTLDDLSSALLMSKSTIYKLFDEQLNTPVMSYVRTKKCMRANSLLLKGCPATEVYLQCGFDDYSSFYRAYVRVFHKPPSKATSPNLIKECAKARIYYAKCIATGLPSPVDLCDQTTSAKDLSGSMSALFFS